MALLLVAAGDFEGQIADVEIYNTALNPLEVQQAYTKTGVFAEGAKAEETAATEETTAPETTAPETTAEETVVAPATTDTTAEKAPQTFDAVTVAAVAMVMSLGSAIVIKKRR